MKYYLFYVDESGRQCSFVTCKLTVLLENIIAFVKDNKTFFVIEGEKVCSNIAVTSLDK